MEIVIVILGVISGVLVFLLIKKQKEVDILSTQITYLKTELAKFEERENYIKSLESNNEKLKEDIQNHLNEIKELERENGILKTKLDESEKSFKEKLEVLKRSEEVLKDSFKNLANEILDSTTKKANENISTFLNPLSEEIKEFKNRIENLSKEEYSHLTLLKEKLEELKNLSTRLSDEANNLTKALKGDKKLQGIWGEVILEKVLELSGLEKGREYEREVVLSDGENTYRPDVVVHLPDNRDIIIDSKVSLNAYANYIESEKEEFLKEHVKNLRKHIDSLASKNYEYLEGVRSLDFIFMFVPLENALSDALNYDKELYEYAFKKRVVLVSPSTLLVSLRVVEAIWRYERQSKNIQEVVKIAESLYDKVRGFLEDFEKIEKNINALSDTYKKAKNKLTDGRGNVISQINKLKEKSGIKPKKEIKWS